MEASEFKPSRLNQKQEAEVVAAIRQGASPHQVARQWQLSLQEAVEYCEAVANEIKSGGIAHRVALRGHLRDQAATAIQTIREVMVNRRPSATPGEKPVDFLGDKKEREIANLRLKAADLILKHAVRFIDEDVVRGFIEQPALNLQETLFDFVDEFEDSGATKLTARERLKLVAGE